MVGRVEGRGGTGVSKRGYIPACFAHPLAAEIGLAMHPSHAHHDGTVPKLAAGIGCGSDRVHVMSPWLDVTVRSRSVGWMNVNRRGARRKQFGAFCSSCSSSPGHNIEGGVIPSERVVGSRSHPRHPNAGPAARKRKARCQPCPCGATGWSVHMQGPPHPRGRSSQSDLCLGP